MFRPLLLALFVAGVLSWTDSHLLLAVSRSCPRDKYYCPKAEYGLFSGSDWRWDVDAIVESNIAEKFRKSRFLTENTVKELKDTFCCTDGPCLLPCGIFPLDEIDLIKAFPVNAKDILGLNMPELERHRPFVTEWMEKVEENKVPKSKLPAELEDFYDAVHQHQHVIRNKLKELKYQ